MYRIGNNRAEKRVVILFGVVMNVLGNGFTKTMPTPVKPVVQYKVILINSKFEDHYTCSPSFAARNSCIISDSPITRTAQAAMGENTSVKVL